MEYQCILTRGKKKEEWTGRLWKSVLELMGICRPFSTMTASGSISCSVPMVPEKPLLALVTKGMTVFPEKSYPSRKL